MGKTVAYIGCIEHGSKPEPALVAESSVPIGDYQYVLRDYGGKLAVFEADSVTPDIVFDVYIKNLPEFDIKELQTGVYARDTEELNRLIEDYIS